jgi:hypothetical protein
MVKVNLFLIAGVACSTILSPSLPAQRIYIGNGHSGTSQDRISVVDVRAGTVLASMHGSLTGLVFSADGTLAWMVADKRIHELDTINFRFTRKSTEASWAPGPVYPSALVLNHRTNRLHRTREAVRGDLLTVDASTLANLPDLMLGPCPSDIALSADEATGYGLDRCTGKLQVLDALAVSIKAQIPMTTPRLNDFAARGNDTVVTSRDGRRIYVSNFRRNEILVLDSGMLSVIERITVEWSFYSSIKGRFALSPDDRYLYAPNPGSTRVWDTLTGRWVGTIPLLYSRLAFGNDGRVIWGMREPNNLPFTLVALETTNFTQVAEISIPHAADMIVMAPDNIPLCEATATPLNDRVRVTRSGLRYNYGSRKFIQTLTVTNISGAPIAGMLSVVLRGLPAGAKLSSPFGSTVCRAPAGDPYVFLPQSWYLGPPYALDPYLTAWPASESRSIILEFSNPTMGAINYSTEVLGDGNH